MAQYQLNITNQKLEQLKKETREDLSLQKLKEIIENGWSKNEIKIPDDIKMYAKHRSELILMNELIYKGQSVVIPNNMREEILNKIHYSHLGANKCMKLAEDSVFWPGITNHINQKVDSCHVCCKYANSLCKEPLKQHDIPTLPWNKVGWDIYQIHNKNYILVVDYYSKYIEIEEINTNMTSNVVIEKKLETIFAKHGIPLTVVTDGGPQFTSKEFKTFAKEYEFEHVITSPTNAQANGLAERNIQTVEKMFKKIIEEGKDINLALLHLRNTSLSGNISPAGVLMSRELRSNLIFTK